MASDDDENNSSENDEESKIGEHYNEDVDDYTEESGDS